MSSSALPPHFVPNIHELFGAKLDLRRRHALSRLSAGTILGAQRIALAAVLGLTGLNVRRHLKGAIFSTGGELVEPGASRGGAPAAWRDLVITSGGVSAGEADPCRQRGRAHRQLFWRVAIKPGRLVAMGVIRAAPRKDYAAHVGATFFGLPGNPAPVFVTFMRVVKPLLLRLSGALPQTLVAIPVSAPFAGKKKDRREYVRMRCAASPTARSRRSSTSRKGWHPDLAHWPSCLNF